MGMRPGLTERLQVAEAEAGRRVDAVLADAFGVSRSLLADWFSRGLVRAESRSGRRDRVLAKSAKAVAGETLAVDVPDDPDPLEVRAERCLLYTSPSPRDRTRSRMPSSA